MRFCTFSVALLSFGLVSNAQTADPTINDGHEIFDSDFAFQNSTDANQRDAPKMALLSKRAMPGLDSFSFNWPRPVPLSLEPGILVQKIFNRLFVSQAEKGAWNTMIEVEAGYHYGFHLAGSTNILTFRIFDMMEMSFIVDETPNMRAFTIRSTAIPVSSTLFIQGHTDEGGGFLYMEVLRSRSSLVPTVRPPPPPVYVRGIGEYPAWAVDPGTRRARLSTILRLAIAAANAKHPESPTSSSESTNVRRSILSFPDAVDSHPSSPPASLPLLWPGGSPLTPLPLSQSAPLPPRKDRKRDLRALARGLPPTRQPATQYPSQLAR